MSAIRSRSFKMAGQIIAHSIVQTTVGFPFLSNALYTLISTGDDDQVIATMSVEDILLGETRSVIEEVCSLQQ